jgi:hypothetical protein
VSERISAGLANEEGSGCERIVIDATYLKANRTAASLWKKGVVALHRTHQERVEFRAPRGVWRAG